jgi:hypothetical protein
MSPNSYSEAIVYHPLIFLNDLLMYLVLEYSVFSDLPAIFAESQVRMLLGIYFACCGANSS